MFPMKVEITITNAVQLQTLAALLAGDSSKLPVNQVGPGGETKTEVKPETKSDIPETVATAKVEDAPNTPVASTETTYTLDDAKKLTMKIVADKGRDAAVELLSKFGVKVAAKLPEDQVSAFCRLAEEILNG